GESSSQRLAFLKKHKQVVERRDDLLTTMLDLMVQHGQFAEALNYYQTHHFHNWEGRYSIHNAYMDANIGMAKTANNPDEALKCYLLACEYPENLEVAPRTPDLRGFLHYPMSQLYLKTGNSKEAKRLLKISAEEVSEKPTLCNLYRSLALRDLGEIKMAKEVLAELKNEAQELLDGKTEGYGNRSKDFLKALGHYYLSVAAEADKDMENAQNELDKAKSIVPLIEREALIYAQIVYAKAKQ
ncbi:MAG TPA: hypothetical protein VGD14_06185, partial [bacterium]